MDFKKKTLEYLVDELDVELSALEELIEIPPQRDMGDFAIPCFRFAKILKKSPAVIAQDFADKLDTLPEFIDRVEVAGPYLNIFLNVSVFNKTITSNILESNDLLKFDWGSDKTVLLDYSSPNIAKPFHVGHAFTTILGDVLARMYASTGYEVVRINHLGDYGTQFGKLIVAYENWGDASALEEDAIKELLRIYVKFHDEAKLNPELEDQARAKFRNLEAGEAYEYELWEKFREFSLNEFKRIYNRLGMYFDSYKGEAFYIEMLDKVVNLLEEKGILVDSQGAKIVDLEEYSLPPVIVRKSDGSSIYATRDIAAALYRHKRYNFDKLLYVVGQTQELHFKQLFATLKKAGFDWADNMEFVGFGLVKFPEGVKLSTRSGDVVYLEDLINEAVSRTKAVIEKNNENSDYPMSQEEIDKASEIIALASVRYTFLRNGRERDIVFSWDEILDYEGDTAPYMLYSYARARSILRKSGVDASELKNADLSILSENQEFELLTEINNLPASLEQALKHNEPSIFARQVMTVCRSFSRFYNQVSILQADTEDLKIARLALIEAFSKTVKTALALLGIDTVERM